MAAKKKAATAAKKPKFKPVTADSVKALVKLRDAGKLPHGVKLTLDTNDNPPRYRLEVPTGAKSETTREKIMHTVFSMDEDDFARDAAVALGFKIVAT